VTIGESTAHVVGEALSWAEASGGSFDPALAGAIVLWDVGQRLSPPPAADLRPFSGGGLYRKIELGTWRGASIVRFHSPEVGIDLGGIAKGYGVDRAVEALRGWGIGSALVNLGGDLYALGPSEDGDPWKIGIRSSRDPDRIEGTIAVTDRAVATSGDYAQYFDHRGRRYHHLLDPRTAEPREVDTHSVTVTATNCMAADAAATAIFGCDPRVARRTLRTMVPDGEVIHL
jgi:thiamine biosynthesis lipoprotein